MAETYNWQTMSYTELSFLDKHFDVSVPEQAALRGQLRAYTSGRVKDFAEGNKLIQNTSEYKLLHGLINDASLNGSEADGGKSAAVALQAFGQVKGFKNTLTGELDIYDPRCGLSVDEFKASMLEPQQPISDYKPDGTTGQEVADKKEISAEGVSQAAAEKMQEQMSQILNAHKMDAEAVQSMQEDMVKQEEAGNAQTPQAVSEASAEKTNEEKELDKGKTDENTLGADLTQKQLELHAAENINNAQERQVNEALLAKESGNWQEYAKNNPVMAETVKEEKTIVTKIFDDEAQKEAGNHNAIIMRSDENNAFIGGPKKEKNNTADMSVFLQVAKSAKKEGFTSIFIGKDLSPEAKEKAAAAAAIEKLKVSGDKPKEIDLKKSYIKELPPTARKEIRRYNYSNMNADERKEYKRKQKLLRKTGRLKRANDGNIQAPQNSFINENSAELQATVTGKMLPGNSYEGGRE